MNMSTHITKPVRERTAPGREPHVCCWGCLGQNDASRRVRVPCLGCKSEVYVDEEDTAALLRQLLAENMSHQEH